MKERSEKQKDLEQLKKELVTTKHIFVAGYEKMTVAQDFELRKTVRGVGGVYQVVKNTLAAKASEGTSTSELLGDLKGMTSVAYTNNDPVALAKALINYAKTNPALVFKAGMVDGRVIEVKSIQELAALPPKEEVLSKLLFMINASAQRLVTAIGGVGRNLAIVVDQGVKENKFQG